MNFLQNDIIASLSLELMTFYDDNRRSRKRLFDKYNAVLRQYREFKVFARYEDDSYLMYVVRLNAAYVDDFRSYLAQNGISTSHHYPSLSRHPLFENRIACPHAMQIEREIISLPCFVELSVAQFDRIKSAIDSFARSRNFEMTISKDKP